MENFNKYIEDQSADLMAKAKESTGLQEHEILEIRDQYKVCLYAIIRMGKDYEFLTNKKANDK